MLSVIGVTRIPLWVEEDDEVEVVDEDVEVVFPVCELVGELSVEDPSVTGFFSQLPKEIPNNLMQGR